MFVNAVRERASRLVSGVIADGKLGIDPTRDLGDPGILGPQSVSWEVLQDPSSLVGGVRALLLQAAHPRVVQGVVDHSIYKEDSMGRLARTVWYVTATTYGSTEEAREAAAMVKRVHERVKGVTPEGEPYSANDPRLLEWVHLTLVESLLVSYKFYGGRRLEKSEEDLFVKEQARGFALLSDTRTAESVEELGERMRSFKGELRRTAATEEAVRFLRKPTLPSLAKPVYRAIYESAVATIGENERAVLNLRDKQWFEGGVRAAGGVLTLGWRTVVAPSEVASGAKRRANGVV